jgi:hypothetical protein
MSQNASDFLRDGTLALSKAGLAEGTNANTFQINAPNGAGVDYAIKGRTYHKADTDNLAFSDGHTALAASQQCVFGVQLDTSGNVTTKQSNIVDTADLEAGNDQLHWPVADDNKVIVGYIRVETSDSGAFTPGSTDLGDAQVTDTYYDVMLPPAAPLAS